MKTYMSSYNLRLEARDRLKGNWPMAIGVHAIFLIISALVARVSDANTGLIYSLLTIVSSGVLGMAIARFNLKLNENREARLEDFLDGFNDALNGIIVRFIFAVFVALWTMLLIIPGIVKAIAYSQAMYILNDHPDMKPLAAITLSKEMMQGHKGRYFSMLLGFIGWAFLSLFTFGLGLFVLIPYVHQTTAAFYADLKGERYSSSNDFDDMNDEYTVEAKDFDHEA